MRLELLDPILNRLHNLKGIIEKQESFRFYSSSLLIMYGGKAGDVSETMDVTDDGCDNVNNGHLSTPTPASQCCDGSVANKDASELYCGASDDSCDSTTHSTNLLTKTDNQQVDVRMIDFAHSTHRGFPEDTLHKGLDQGYLFGLKNLISIFMEIKQRYSEENPSGNV